MLTKIFPLYGRSLVHCREVVSLSEIVIIWLYETNQLGVKQFVHSTEPGVFLECNQGVFHQLVMSHNPVHITSLATHIG